MPSIRSVSGFVVPFAWRTPHNAKRLHFSDTTSGTKTVAANNRETAPNHRIVNSPSASPFDTLAPLSHSKLGERGWG